MEGTNYKFKYYNELLMEKKVALSIAGSDPSGGAGIQADVKSFSYLGLHGVTAITCITSQNTMQVKKIHRLPVEVIENQIDVLFEDFSIDAVKTGMLYDEEIIELVSKKIIKYHLGPVVDPVMVAKSGDPLLSKDARLVVKERMLPLATVITPNIFEAEVLLNKKIETIEEMKMAAAELKKTGCKWVVIKGGHLSDKKEAIDVVYNGKEFHLLQSPFFPTKNTHGTGCTFSSAIAAGLAKNYEPLQTIKQAKQYITQAIKNGLSIGKGHGPTNHFVGIKSAW